MNDTVHPPTPDEGERPIRGGDGMSETMKIIKQLFCKHIWKEGKEEYLGKRMGTVYTVGVGVEYKIISRYAIYMSCIKCEKLSCEEMEAVK